MLNSRCTDASLDMIDRRPAAKRADGVAPTCRCVTLDLAWRSPIVLPCSSTGADLRVHNRPLMCWSRLFLTHEQSSSAGAAPAERLIGHRKAALSVAHTA